MKKKVVFFIYELGAGGAARTFVNIVNYINKETFEPIIVTLNYSGSYEKYVHEDVRIEKLPAKRLRSAIVPFRDFIKKEQPDIVFSTIPNYNTIAIIARLLSRTKAKTIVREAAFLGGSVSENMKLFFFGQLYRFAHKVIALSNGVKENIVSKYFVPENKISVIYNPIDLVNIQKLAEEDRFPDEHEVIFQQKRKTIVTAGRLVPEKDQKTLIKAFAEVKKRQPVNLIILGEGALIKELQEKARKLQVEEDVHFLGFQENPYKYFKRADVFALSSEAEGFGHVLVEALATETLIVSTNCKPGAEEVLQNGRYGLITPVGDAETMADQLEKALTMSTEEKMRRQQEGLYRAKEFSAETIVRQYERVFLETIGADE